MAYLKVDSDGIVYKCEIGGRLVPFLLGGQQLHAANGYIYTESEMKKLRQIGAAAPTYIKKEVEGYLDPRKRKKGIITFCELLVVGDDNLVYACSGLRRNNGSGMRPFPIEDTDF